MESDPQKLNNESKRDASGDMFQVYTFLDTRDNEPTIQSGSKIYRGVLLWSLEPNDRDWRLSERIR